MQKKHLALFMAVILTVCSFVTAFADDNVALAEEETVAEVFERNVSFDRSEVIRETIPMQLYGYSCEYTSMRPGYYAQSLGMSFLWNNDGSPNQDAIEDLKDYPFEHVRFGGGSWNQVKWKEDIAGDWRKYLRFNLSYNSNKVASGAGYANGLLATNGKIAISGDHMNIERAVTNVVQLIKNFQAYNPEMTFTYTVNILRDDFQDAVDIVEFLASDGSINYNGGENWGKIRKEKYGIDKVNMFAWEIGNEVDLDNATIEEYNTYIKQFVPAIRAIDKETPIAAHIATSDTGAVGVDWQRRLIMECGDLIDYLVMHKYIGHNAVAAVAESTLRRLISDIEMFGDPERHKIIFTEYNGAYVADAVNNNSLAAAVTMGDFIIRMLQYPMVTEADIHAVSGGGGSGLTSQFSGADPNGYFKQGAGHQTYYVSEDGSVKPVATTDVLKMLADASRGAKVIGTDMQDFELGRGAMASAIALEQPNGDICLFFANFYEENDLKINIQNDGYYLKEDIVLYGNNGKFSINLWGRHEVEVERNTYTDTTECKSYTTSPLSFVMLRLSPIK